MSAVPPPTQDPSQGAAGQQPAGSPAPQQSTPPQQNPGLPPTGLQSQMQSLNSYYDQVRNASTELGGIGFDPYQQQFQQGQQEMGPARQSSYGSTSLDQMARSLAQQYGLPIGRGSLVDERGNFLVTPDQIVAASGGQETLGTASAKLNQIGQAITREQNEKQQKLGISAIQSGMGQLQDRGRGSLASLQSGLYQDLADLYSNQEYEAADFSFWIQKEQLDIQQELQRRAEKQAKKAARAQTIAGVGMVVAGVATGNVALVGYGASSAAGGAAGSGWF